MASTIGLSAYTLRLRHRNAREPGWLTLSRNGEVDAWELLHRHLLDRKNEIVDLRGFEEKSNGQAQYVAKAFRLTKLKSNDDKGTLAGTIESGDYGRASTIVDVSTKKLAHRKSVNEADMPPFYFRIHVPDGGTTAVMAMQRIGIQGLKSSIEMDLKRYFAGVGYTAKLGVLTDEDLLESYLTHGTLEEITVATHTVPSDPREAIKHTKINGERPPTGTKVEIKFSKEKGFGGMLKTAAAAFRRKKNASDLVEVYGLENPEEVTFLVDMDGNKRKFRIMHPDEVGLKYDVTEDVEYDSDHHPTFDSIDSLARTWCKSLLKQVNASIDGN